MGPFVTGGDNLDILMSNIIHPQTNLPWFHPSVMPGEIDFPSLMGNADEKNEKKSFNLNVDQSPVVKRFREFIDRYKSQIYALLEEGPIRFSSFLTTLGFELLPGEYPTDFIGVYTMPKVLDDEESGGKILVGLTGQEFRHQVLQDKMFIASDLLIYLENQKG